MAMPSTSNPHTTADAARRLPVSPSWRGPTAGSSYRDAAPSRFDVPTTGTADSSPILSARTNPDARGAARTHAPQSDARTTHTQQPERDRLRASIAPFVHQVTQFCSNDAIRLAGNWNARLVLDERILPGTTLNLSLSCFDLSLVFETRDPAARHVLVAHVDELEQLLRASLHALGQPQDVFLTIR
ncbi:type III secretion system protein SctP [Burkholderia ubonensis]|uniref:type III secretion system protein SctP n=1 Tax=Burkholderia ubonensis TaxID=101571 RepID=UPI0009B37FFC|nr:type III secretion system protein SctP [Burkholderia ubonensis]